MKFIDLINEDDQSEWDKLYKKTQLVFKTLRKGRIRTKSGVVFSYKIPEKETHISVASSSGKDDLTAYVMCEKIKIREESKECSDISYSMFGELIKRKFSHFDILFIFNVYPEDIEKYEPQPINENEEEEKVRLLKKARTVYKAHKRGKYKSDNQGHREDALFSYRLSDEPNIMYWKSRNNDTDVRIECEIFIKYLNEVANWTKTDQMIKHIVNKFKNHGIDINIKEWTYNWELYTEPTEPLNEDTDDIKVRLTKKANAVYTALKKGTLKYYLNGEENEPAIYTYKLSDGKRVVISGLDEIHIVPDEIKIREENRECSKTSLGGVEKLLKQKFEGFNINLNLHNFYPGDVDTWLDREHPPFGWANNTQPINEDNDRRIKRARTIYKALKKGLLNRGEHGSIKYILPDEYDVHIRSIDDEVIIKVGDEESENPVIFLYSDDDGRDDRPAKVGPKYYYTFVEKLGHKYFEDFGIKLIC
jgi:DNA polymerase III delta prime subunit